MSITLRELAKKNRDIFLAMVQEEVKKKSLQDAKEALDGYLNEGLITQEEFNRFFTWKYQGYIENLTTRIREENLQSDRILPTLNDLVKNNVLTEADLIRIILDLAANDQPGKIQKIQDRIQEAYDTFSQTDQDSSRADSPQ